MANIIKPKRSNTAAKVPTTTDLTSGELGVNMADQKVYINNGTSVVQVGAGNLSGLGDVAIATPTNSQVLAYDSASGKWKNSAAGAGTVTSVTGTAPVVSSGGATPAISLAANYGDTLNPYASKTANYFLAAPNGAAGVPTFRAIVAADIPTLNQNTTGTASNVTGTVAIANGGTGATTAATARTNLGAAASGANSDITGMTGITGGISTPDYIDFDTVAAPTMQAGRIGWDDGYGTEAVGLKGGNVTLYDGQQLFVRAYNGSGTAMTKGQIVYIVGAQGNRVDVRLAQANAESTSANTIGMVAEAIAAGGEGFVQVSGSIPKLDTNTLTAGQALYLSPTTAGAYTTTKPTAPNHLVVLGWVERVSATVGSIYLKVDNGYELDELHNVNITSATSGNTLIYDATAGYWKNANISAGTGISVTNGAGSITVTNSAPDQTVALTGSGATTISGTYPNFTISSVNTTYGAATSTVAGLIELGSDTQQTVAANAVTATASRTYALQVNAAGQGVVNVPWTDTNSGGTVTSVGGTGTVSGLTLSGTVTTSGNLTLGGTLSVTPSNFASQTANTVLAAPNGAAGVPTFRAIVAADIPTLNQNTTGTAANVTGTVAIANGGTGATTAATARTNLGATTVGGNLFTLTNPSAVTFPRFNADNTVSALDAANFRTAIGAGTSSTTGTVTSVSGAGSYGGLTLSGTVTTSGSLTLGGTPTGTWPISVSGSSASATTATNQSGGTVNATSVLSSAGVSDAYSGLRVVNPGGGALINSSGTVTGAIKIKLPVASLNSATMLRLTIKIYEYNTGYSRTFEIGGYNYSGGNWYNWFATQSSQSGGDMNVRFGQDATSDCIWIGETSSSWSYPQVFITDVQCGYSNTTQAMWASGWAVSFVTAFDTVEQSTVAYRPLSSGNYNSYAPTLTGTNASGTWGINITGNSANVTGTVAVANGGTGATTAATARTNLGATTVGGNMFTLTNPSAVTFPRFNADNTISALDAATFRTAIGAGTSSTTGTVTSVGGTGTVSGLTLSGTVTTSGNLTLGGTLSVTPSNFASQTANTVLAAPNGTAGVPTFRAIVAADIPTLNQNTTGTASNVTGTVAVANGGTGATTAAAARTNLGAGTVNSVGGTGTVSGLTLTGTVTSSGSITLGGNLTIAADMIYDTFTATASQTTFTTSNTYTSGKIEVYVNGVKLRNGTDVTVTSGTTVVMAVGLAVNSLVDLVYPI